VSEYRFDLLGWYQFERLCQTLLLAACGLEIEAWGGSRDWGRDAYATGPLRFPDPEVAEPGPFVFQAKFVRDAVLLGERGVAQLKGAVVAEATKLGQWAATGEWDAPAHYALMTNVRVPNGERDAVLKPIADVLPDARLHLKHEPDLEILLTANPRVRMSFPQVLGLRDLRGLIDEVVNRDVRNRADVLLEAAANLAAVFVPTHSYFKAVETLAKHHFVVLAGPPEMGKTSIARMIALARAADGWGVVSCTGPSDFERAYIRDADQIFVADDAFGSTEYRPERADDWAASMGDIIRRLDRRHWLAWTSRSEPLRRGLETLHFQDEAEEFPDPAKVLVDATQLTTQEKTLMLYRHAKAAGLSSDARELVKKWGERIVRNEHFTPLRVSRFVTKRAERLAESAATYKEIARAVEEELEEPTLSMSQSFAVLSEHQKDLLVSLLDVNGTLDDTALRAAYHRHRHDGGPDAALLAHGLEEHFLRRLS